MSLLNPRASGPKTKAIENRVYNADWVYGPTGGITATEINDLKEGDYDRKTGERRCVFCRQVKPLLTGNGTTCDDYCETNEYGYIPVGRPYPFDQLDRGRGWLTLA